MNECAILEASAKFGSAAVEAAARELSRLTTPLRPVQLALEVSFPERSLVQWDSGKFHTLAPLLRQLKRGGHRCLIFTQMSKMLDILEAFLSFHSHAYLRLDGGTKPDDRQRLMDRFNTDTTLFCFVLSTRSGGLGINLTGADTVIFYDSDWNPAMDAQAQDRAHRIGQTRDVHIYRLVCAATIEENILLKARQKQKLEFVAITEGNFDSEHISDALAATKKEALEAAMAQLEDEEDAAGARAATLEASADALEFDEKGVQQQQGQPPALAWEDSAANTNTNTNEGEDEDEESEERRLEVERDREKKESDAEAERLEAEFAAWQDRVGPDPTALAASLSRVEQHCLVLREEATPCDASFLAPAERRLFDEQAAAQDEDWDVDAIEAAKAAEEAKALASGDLIATEVYDLSVAVEKKKNNNNNNNNKDGPTEGSGGGASSTLDYERSFVRQRRAARSAAAQRRCTGAAWEQRTDGLTGAPFWYNVDTGEATWVTPGVIIRRDADAAFRAGGFAVWPADVAANVIGLLAPAPDRARAASVCRAWMAACADDRLLLRVNPVERLTDDEDQLRRADAVGAERDQLREEHSLFLNNNQSPTTRRRRVADGHEVTGPLKPPADNDHDHDHDDHDNDHDIKKKKKKKKKKKNDDDDDDDDDDPLAAAAAAASPVGPTTTMTTMTTSMTPPWPLKVGRRTACYSLRCALRRALPGETIVLAPGHYWEDAADLLVDRRVRIVGDVAEPARVVVELAGALRWRAAAGCIVGVTLRRPHLIRPSTAAAAASARGKNPGGGGAAATTTAALIVEGLGSVCMARSIIVDNDGCGGAACVVDEGAFFSVDRSKIVAAAASAVLVKPGGACALSLVEFRHNKHALFASTAAAVVATDCDMRDNARHAIVMLQGSAVVVQHSDCSGFEEPVLRETHAKLHAKANLGLPDTRAVANKKKTAAAAASSASAKKPPPASAASSSSSSSSSSKPNKPPAKKKPKLAPSASTLNSANLISDVVDASNRLLAAEAGLLAQQGEIGQNQRKKASTPRAGGGSGTNGNNGAASSSV